jgi:hypothetical protein
VGVDGERWAENAPLEACWVIILEEWLMKELPELLAVARGCMIAAFVCLPSVIGVPCCQAAP